jgi:hypothetical protein
MAKGLKISVGGIPLDHEPQKLFVSERLKPVFVEKIIPRNRIDNQKGPPVKVKLYAGIAERSFHDGGWYVFCNGRMVLRADQTPTTIWSQVHGLRQYHPDLAFFRGYAYFDSDHSALLPWTTTKTGVDVDSPVYKAVQQDMIEISKPVLAFLSSLAKERAALEHGDSADRTLALAVETSKAEAMEAIPFSKIFIAPPPAPTPPGPRMQKIQYSKSADEVAKAMQMLKVSTFTAVGEKTFEYFMKYEKKS